MRQRFRVEPGRFSGSHLDVGAVIYATQLEAEVYRLQRLEDRLATVSVQHAVSKEHIRNLRHAEGYVDALRLELSSNLGRSLPATFSCSDVPGGLRLFRLAATVLRPEEEGA